MMMPDDLNAALGRLARSANHPRLSMMDDYVFARARAAGEHTSGLGSCGWQRRCDRRRLAWIGKRSPFRANTGHHIRAAWISAVARSFDAAC